MVFSSSIFLFWFLPLFLAAYFGAPKGARSLLLSAFSLIFYGFWRPDFVLLMIGSTVLDFACGLGIGRAHAQGRSGKSWLLVSMIGNLGLLGVFKYSRFLLESIAPLALNLGLPAPPLPDLVLPVGISFFTFQTMSYTIDVYRKDVTPTRNFIDFLSYVTMFPQLVAGPIVRYRTVAEQLSSRSHSLEGAISGLLCFQVGFAKKILLADPMGTIADAAFGSGTLSFGDAWVGILAYAFQIYFDFSGYSDMAIGIGLILGFTFPWNFSSPYRATSITDFWRRWHITLSTWLRDYLYRPLGGNRRGPVRTYVNLLLVMLLGGLWHGAQWTFVAWGAWHGTWLAAERLMKNRRIRIPVPTALKMSWTFLLVLIGWVFFRSKDLGHAGFYLQTLFTPGELSLSAIPMRPLQVTVLATCMLVLWAAPKTEWWMQRFRPAFALVLQLIFIFAMLHLDYQAHVPFLYYQF